MNLRALAKKIVNVYEKKENKRTVSEFYTALLWCCTTVIVHRLLVIGS